MNWRSKKLTQSAKHESCVSCDADHGTVISKRILKICENCGNNFSIPRCRDWREHCCSSDCKKEHRQKKSLQSKESRKRTCFECGSIFYPRQSQIDSGGAKYCCRTCQVRAMIRIAHKDESNKKRAESVKMAMQGKYRSGPDHPQWNGGKKASIQRVNEKRKNNPEIYRAKRRAYLAANPDKAREWARSRGRRKNGRLPRGSVKALLVMQKYKCAICNVAVKLKFHVDHIVPLALGGEHSKKNIQILCPSCNVRKSAKDPISYMQELGLLI